MSRPRAPGKAPTRKLTTLNISPPRPRPSTSEITQRLRDQHTANYAGATTSTQADVRRDAEGNVSTGAEASGDSLDWEKVLDYDKSGSTSGASRNRSTSDLNAKPTPASQQLSTGGLPGSFDGMSGIGGQASVIGESQFEESQVEESLPPAKFSAWSQLDRVDFEASYEPASQAHENIIYNTSGTPVSWKDGTPLRPLPVEPSPPPPLIEPPTRSKLRQTTHKATGPTSPQKQLKHGSGLSPTKSSAVAPRQPGEYDPADDRIRFDAPAPVTPGGYRSGTTGPRLILPKGVRPRAPSPICIDDDESPEGSTPVAAPQPGSQPRSQASIASGASFSQSMPPPPLPRSTGPVLGATIDNPLILSSSEPAGSPPRRHYESDTRSRPSPSPQPEMKDYHHAGYYVTPGSGMTPPREDMPLVPAAPDSEPRKGGARTARRVGDASDKYADENHTRDRRRRTKASPASAIDVPAGQGNRLARQSSGASLLDDYDGARPTYHGKSLTPIEERDSASVRHQLLDERPSSRPRELQVQDTHRHRNSPRGKTVATQPAPLLGDESPRRGGRPTGIAVEDSMRKRFPPNQQALLKKDVSGASSAMQSGPLAKTTAAHPKGLLRTDTFPELEPHQSQGDALPAAGAVGYVGSSHESSSSGSKTVGKNVLVGGTPSQSQSNPSQQSDPSQSLDESPIVVPEAQEPEHYGELAVVPLPRDPTQLSMAEVEAEVDADQVIPETQFSQDPAAEVSQWRSPVILYSNRGDAEDAFQTQESQSQPPVVTRLPRVLIPATASATGAEPSQGDPKGDGLSRNVSIVIAESQLEESQFGVSGPVERVMSRPGGDSQLEESSTNGIGGQDPNASIVGSTSQEKEKSSSDQTGSYVFSDPKPATARPPPPAPATRTPEKRTHEDDPQDDGEKRDAKRAKKVDRALSKTPAVQRIPTSGKSKPLQALPPPPPRPETAHKTRQKSVVPVKEPVTPIQRARNTDDYTSPSGILDFSSTLTPLPDTSAEREPPGAEVSPSIPAEPSPRKGGWRTYIHGQTLVTKYVKPSTEKHGEETKEPGADPDDPETQDPFKLLAKPSKATKRPAKKTVERNLTASPEPVPAPEPVTTRRVTRSQSQAVAESQTSVKPKGRKRSLYQSLHDDPVEATASAAMPPPPKRMRKGPAPAALPTIEASPQASPTRTPVQHLQRTDRLDVACQSGGRVFAPLSKMYLTATVVDYQHKAERATFKGKGKAKSTKAINCKVKFDDGTWEEIILTELRRCELREGDELRIPGKKGAKFARTGHVSAVPSWVQRNAVSVRTAAKPKEEVTVVQGKDIGVTLEVINRDWDDRCVSSVEDIGLGEELARVQEEMERAEQEAKAKGKTPKSTTFGPPKWKDSPPPPPFRERSSSPPLARKRSTQVTVRSKKGAATSPARPISIAHSTSVPEHSARLVGFSFIIALAVHDAEGEKIPQALRKAKKTELAEIITRHGGRVVEDGFDSLFDLGGQTSDDNARWIWNAGDMSFFDDAQATKRKVPAPSSSSVPEVKLERYFLLADSFNRNQKYLIALAAGIPCVNSEWISTGVKTSWKVHILPAGTSTNVDKPWPQWIDNGYVDHPRSLRDIHENPGTLSRPFKNKSLLFVYPSKAKIDIEEDEFSSTYVLPTLACLMGASRVEIVHSLKSSSLAPPEYDIVVYEEDSAVPASLTKSLAKAHASTIVGTKTWVSDCLITGELLPI